MEEERNSFVFYRTFIEQMEGMPEEEQLILLKAIIQYGLDKTETEFDKFYLNGFFKVTKLAIDNATERYDSAIENGSKGGRPSRMTDEQKTEICRRYQNGESYETIAKLFGCSASSVRNIIIKNLKVNNNDGINAGGFNCQNLKGFDCQNLNIDVDVNVDKDIDVNKDVDIDVDKDSNNSNATNDTDLLSRLINKSFYLGTQIDEPTAERIISFCEEHLLPDPVGWFQFCWEKTSSKGLLHEKDRDEAKRIVVSAAINKNGKWSYLPEDYQKWYQERHPKAWSSGITLPPKEECVPADQVGQFFQNIKAKKPETA